MGDDAPVIVIPTNYGRIEEFNDKGDWIEYTERLDHYFEANEINNADKKRAILLSACGQRTYKLIRTLCAPTKPKDKTFKDIVDLVKTHQHPKPSSIVERCRFNSRVRHPDESVSQFVAELRSLSEHCDYKDTLDHMLRDRLVCGIKDDRIQRRLLAETDLTFKRAMDISTAMEMAAKNAQDIQASGILQNSVNKVTKGKPRSNYSQNREHEQSDCYRCGGNHKAAECRFRDAKCHICQKKGHIAKKCRNRDDRNPQFQRSNANSGSRFYKKQAHFVEQDASENSGSESENEVYSVFNLGYSCDAYKVDIQVNNKIIIMEIDTGASVSIMSEETYKEFESKFKLEPTSVKLRTYLGDSIPVLGRATVNVTYGKENNKLPLFVVKRKGPNLLGRDWISKIQLNWKEIFAVHVLKDQPGLEETLSTYNDVFKDELGAIKGVKAKIYVDENATPKYFKARPLPYALKEKVELELEGLEKRGQISRVEFSEWAAPIVPIVKENGSIRICGDYKITVNRVSKLDNYPIPKTEDLYATLAGGEEYTKLDLAQAYQQIELRRILNNTPQ
ncbi:Hypothetical predicted protein [Mytilus galloprovincialis]|uniref:CCHC-type domain-containing protein n=1 Tax=Mytilus galloprovincialis TaxID=29158 RepID=A0A8B6FWE5_MYTGA|nr:Hypothetical predicted protein [Mytilus galloprovincialis]